jgi:hypothetical protein
LYLAALVVVAVIVVTFGLGEGAVLEVYKLTHLQPLWLKL